ncbi:MAG: hypothetical protein ACTHOD_00215 [Motilibacteraceae bacterium]
MSAVGSGLSTTGMLLVLSAPGIHTRVLAFVSIGWLLGTLLGSTVAGRTTDSAHSLPRRATVADVGAAVVSGLAALGGARAPWTLTLVGGAVLACTAVGANARQVLAARWFGSDVGRFSSLSSALSGAAAAIGGGLAALLVHEGRSLAPLFTADAATFGAAALLRALLPDEAAHPATHATGQGPRGLLPRLGVLALPGVAALVAVFCLAQLAEAVAARLFVPVVLTVFAAPAGWVPLLEGVGVVGAVAGAMLVPVARRLLPGRSGCWPPHCPGWPPRWPPTASCQPCPRWSRSKPWSRCSGRSRAPHWSRRWHSPCRRSVAGRRSRRCSPPAPWRRPALWRSWAWPPTGWGCARRWCWAAFRCWQPCRWRSGPAASWRRPGRCLDRHQPTT